MTTGPGYGHQQNYNPPVSQLKSKLLPGMIVACAAALLAIIGCALPFVQASAYGQSESQSIFGAAFGGGRTIAGVLLIVAVVLLVAGVLGAYFKPTAGQVKRAGILAIVGGAIGVIAVILMMFVFEEEGTGQSVSANLQELNDRGVDAGWGIGMWLTIAAFIIGAVGGVLFTINAGPVERALKAEMDQAMQQPPYQGQQFGAPQEQQRYGQPQQYGAPQGQPPFGAPHGQSPYGAPQQPGQPGYGQPPHSAPQQPGQPGYGQPQYGAPETQPSPQSPNQAPNNPNQGPQNPGPFQQ